MTITYFGYGSLVNSATIPPETQITPGTLHGWVREWRVCGADPAGKGRCALTVREAPGTDILGVMAQEPFSRLDELEARERRYEKVSAIGGAFRCDAENRPGPVSLFLFRAAPEFYRWGNARHPILQSYLDCVLVGFYRIWGEVGIDHFLATTRGWHVPILRDREAALYPRSVKLQPETARLIDDKLQEIGVGYVEPDVWRSGAT